MSYVEVVRSHVERCLQDIWKVCRVAADHDGDYPFRRGTAAGYVRVEPGEPVLVRVWAVAAHCVRSSSKLLKEVNSVNARSRSASVVWDQGMVVVRQSLLASALDREALAQACDAVGAVADDIGALIAGVYGGQTPYPPLDVPAAEQTG